MRLILDLDLPDALGVELEHAAKRSGLAPEMWAGEQIESVLASQRLSHVPVGRYGGRHGQCARETETEVVLTEHRILL